MFSTIISDKKEYCNFISNSTFDNKVLINYKPFSYNPIEKAGQTSYFPLATLSIDNRNIKTLSTLVQFSGILVNASNTQSATITFRVNKCINGTIQTISDIYPVVTPDSVANINPISYPFDFQFCDNSNNCLCNCITYILECNINSRRHRAVTINNAFLSVISFIK